MSGFLPSCQLASSVPADCQHSTSLFTLRLHAWNFIATCHIATCHMLLFPIHEGHCVGRGSFGRLTPFQAVSDPSPNLHLGLLPLVTLSMQSQSIGVEFHLASGLHHVYAGNLTHP